MADARWRAQREPEGPEEGQGPSTWDQLSSGRSVLKEVFAPAVEETGKTLQDVAFAVRYPDFAHLKVTRFEQLRALALSDLYEDISDLARSALLKIPDVTILRELPEYKEIRDRLQQAMAAQRTDVDLEGRAWLNEHARGVARREIVRTLRKGLSEANRDAAKVAIEVLERDMPKLSRNSGDRPIVVLPDEMMERLAHALEVIEKNRPKQLPEKSE